MISDEQKDKFLEYFREKPVVSYAAKKSNIGRATIYRLIEIDESFRTRYEEAKKHGDSHINDLAESKLIEAINNGEQWAIKYWLPHHDPTYYSRDVATQREKERAKTTGWRYRIIDLLKLLGMERKAKENGEDLTEKNIDKYLEA